MILNVFMLVTIPTLRLITAPYPRLPTYGRPSTTVAWSLTELHTVRGGSHSSPPARSQSSHTASIHQQKYLSIKIEL